MDRTECQATIISTLYDIMSYCGANDLPEIKAMARAAKLTLMSEAQHTEAQTPSLNEQHRLVSQ